MSFFAELTQGIVQGFRGARSEDRESGRIERLCRELGWSVDERDARKITLHFKDPLLGIRKLFITGGDEPLVLLAAYSHAILPTDKVPQELLSYLLCRSSQISVGSWEASIDRDDDVLFYLKYVALGGGLTAAVFKFLCEGMIREAAEFDGRMSKAGLLRL